METTKDFPAQWWERFTRGEGEVAGVVRKTRGDLVSHPRLLVRKIYAVQGSVGRSAFEEERRPAL